MTHQVSLRSAPVASADNTVRSRDEALAKMMAAGRKHLIEYSEARLTAWATERSMR